MEQPLFLEQLLGIYFFLVGLLFLFRRQGLRDLINGLKTYRPLILLLALLEIIAGISVALVHSEFTADYRIIVTIIGYWMIIEGLLYFILSKKALKKFLAFFSTSGWFIAGGVIAVIMGAYLIVRGFGWWM